MREKKVVSPLVDTRSQNCLGTAVANDVATHLIPETGT